MSKSVSLLIASVLLPAAALAHPGHGEPGEGWTLAHYVAEPLHLVTGIGLVAVVLAATLLGRPWTRRAAERAL